ncbi:MAG: pyridoxine 5'-phosphate synthase [Nitrospirae bacterium]|nr:pyridoxine 5'-phosphate synthase [Nitrospirota bacterium]
MILGVNVDHVATVRQARGGIEPQPLAAALLAIKGGADGITVHLREDRRHIQDGDLKLLKRKISVELNLEMAALNEMIEIALKVRPDMVTLVPEKRKELTTEGGLNLKTNKKKVEKAVDIIQGAGIPVSLFINPSITDVTLSKKTGAQMVEIHTGRYADSKGKKQNAEFKRVKESIKKALDIGLLVNAGHGLNFLNVKKIASIKGVRGLYIGHSIVSKSIFSGIENAVREMKRLIKDSSR